MSYKIAKIYNNNVVLAAKEGEKQVVIISKGVGFNKKSGDFIEGDAADRKVFYILDEDVSKNEIKQLSYDLEQVETVVAELVEVTKRRLSVENDKLYDALLDHIAFAIQRIKMGLSIENPFASEISILYRREYEVAGIAAKRLRETIHIDIGEAEIGFIALHLYSARKQRHIQQTMKSTRIYSNIIQMVCDHFHMDTDLDTPTCRCLLLSLDRLVTAVSIGNILRMPLANAVRTNLLPYYQLASQIGGILQREINITLGEDATAFLAVDIYKFTQT